jgi:hypothetical protein
VDVVSPDKILAMKEAVAGYLQRHWQSLTRSEVSSFLTNHDALRGYFSKQFGGIDLSNATQFTDIKHQIANQVAAAPSALSVYDLGAWWQHGHNALTQFMYTWFDKILPPRHPSQLYEALLEGVLLFAIVWTIGRRWRKDGMASGAFLTFYPIMRIIGEQFRIGDTPANIWGHEISKGVMYSLLMLAPAIAYWGYWIWRDRRVPWVPARVRTGSDAQGPAEPPPAAPSPAARDGA